MVGFHCGTEMLFYLQFRHINLDALLVRMENGEFHVKIVYPPLRKGKVINFIVRSQYAVFILLLYYVIKYQLNYFVFVFSFSNKQQARYLFSLVDARNLVGMDILFH